MKVGIMQPYFVPYIGYWQLMNYVDKYIIADNINYIKGGWINRNRILIGGEPQFFNLPVIGASQNKHINEVLVNRDPGLINKNLKTIERAYKKAPYFSDVYPLIEKILTCDEDDISKFIMCSFEYINKYLGIEKDICLLSDIERDESLKRQDMVIDICKRVGATEYINAIGGQELYSFDEFASNGIELAFVKTNDFEYKQFNNEFQPNLSIIDVLMFNSVNDVKELLERYTLIKK